MAAVIEPGILAAIRSRLDRALTMPAAGYRPFIVAGAQVGYIDDARAMRLARFGRSLFRVEADGVFLADRPGGERSRSAALADVAGALRAEGALPGWRDELYAISTAFALPPVLHLERGAARYFGVRTFAAHVNGVVGVGRPTSMWLARRSRAKAVDPGMLDNLVGGGITAGLTVEQAMRKEAWEEAGIDGALASTARAAGVIRVQRPRPDGLQREQIFVHDLALPAAFVPVNQDGEAIEHRLVDLDAAARAIANEGGRDEVTVDASLVVLDFLLRNGDIPPHAPWARELDAIRRRGRADPPGRADAR
jgi:8-oxo-dGTP pyrophosphatase MutT (NUDIX family)